MILRPGPAGMLDFIKEVEERCSGKPRELSQREIGMRDAVAWVMGKQYSPLPGRPLDKNLLRNQKGPLYMREINKKANLAQKHAKERQRLDRPSPEYYQAIYECLGWISEGTEGGTPPEF